MVKVVGTILHLKSLNYIDKQFNTTIAIENYYTLIHKLVKEQVPQATTIKNALKEIAPDSVGAIYIHFVKELIYSGKYNSSKLLGEYWQIHVDATQQHTFGNTRHCEHCLTRTHTDKEGIEHTTYYHTVLVASIVLGEMEIPIASVYIENPNINPSKQDCEINAFKERLAPLLRELFPKLKMCLIMDGLYAGQSEPELAAAERRRHLLLSIHPFGHAK
jgi:hypothetical protein